MDSQQADDFSGTAADDPVRYAHGLRTRDSRPGPRHGRIADTGPTGIRRAPTLLSTGRTPPGWPASVPRRGYRRDAMKK
jgi:hypothetical protein